MCTFLYVSATRAGEMAARGLIRRLSRDERGQASAEYALVLMAAAGLAILFGTWAVRNGNVQKIFENVLKSILGDMG
ncbi:MAG: DUF4244 domain-containing protein [Actinobacteria bacterium]|nr:DUF4244 domain-containing protein [Actinomycetota bacterium]